MVQVCFEEMGPPTRIFQCRNGHLICETCKYVNIATQQLRAGMKFVKLKLKISAPYSNGAQLLWQAVRSFLASSLWNTLWVTIIATITGQTQVYATAQDVERKSPAEQSTQKIFSGFISLVIEFQSTIRFRFYILISFDTRIMFSNAVLLVQLSLCTSIPDQFF